MSYLFYRPPANALSSDLMRGIMEAVEECERDEATGAILLTSSNKSIFCGGLELQEMVGKDEGFVWGKQNTVSGQYGHQTEMSDVKSYQG